MKALIDYLKLEFSRLLRWLKWPVWYLIVSMVGLLLIATKVLAPEWGFVILISAFGKFMLWLQER